MPPFDKKATTKIRNREVRFASRTLKSGETAYYRDGKRVTTSYQVRLAKGVLAGKSVKEARGHPFGKYDGKLLSRSDIEAQEEFHLGAWAESPRRSGRGQTKATYYIKVMVTSRSKQEVGSPTGEDTVCEPVTLSLRNPDSNTQTGFTYAEVSRDFERLALFTVRKSGMTLCTGELSRDLIHVWRHSRR